jgi:hypothetical protein
MFRCLIHCKAAWCDSNDDLKKVTWKASAVHTTSVTHSQFDKHLIMTFVASGHSALLTECCALHQVMGLSHRLQVKTDTSGTQLRNCTRPYPIPRCILKILEELSTFTFHQPTIWVDLTNSKITSQSTIPHSTKADLFYSVQEINIPNIVWDSCEMQ